MHSTKAVALATVLAVALTAGIGVALASGGDDRSKRRAVAALRDGDGRAVGIATLRERHGEVSISAKVRHLAPGFHGFHVHSVGECTPPFTSAGGHFNPGGAQHGDHAGDLPSLLVNEDGRGKLRFVTDRFSVGDLFDGDGSALIVHAGRDNYANIPDRYHSHATDAFGPDADTLATGDAGTRAACGIVRRAGDR